MCVDNVGIRDYILKINIEKIKRRKNDEESREIRWPIHGARDISAPLVDNNAQYTYILYLDIYIYILCTYNSIYL